MAPSDNVSVTWTILWIPYTNVFLVRWKLAAINAHYRSLILKTNRVQYGAHLESETFAGRSGDYLYMLILVGLSLLVRILLLS